MVSWRARVGAVVASLALVGAAGISTAHAKVAGTGTTVQPHPGGSNSGGSGGTGVRVTAGQCHYYVVPSGRFGHSCNGTLTGRTVREILGNDLTQEPTCWDVVMTTQDIDDYQLAPIPTGAGFNYYIQECANPGGFSPDFPPSYQPNLQINEQVVEIWAPQSNCVLPYVPVATGLPAVTSVPVTTTCVMVLTPAQQQVVDPGTVSSATVPGILLVRHPTTTVRTNEPVSYSDEMNFGNPGANHSRTDTTVLNGSAMWAELTDFRIYPYGLAGGVTDDPCTLGPTQMSPLRDADRMPGVCKVCAGVASVQQSDTPASTPQACWWAYDRGSAVVPVTNTYPMRAQATWTIFYLTGLPGAQRQVLSTVVEYDDIQQPVLDVQSVVIGTG